MLWRFRRRLASDPRNLPVFLRAVDWGVPMEVAEATQLMARWAPLSEAQALDLLGPDMSHPAVRTCAIDVLRSTSSDEDLVLYLPQARAINGLHSNFDACDLIPHDQGTR